MTNAKSNDNQPQTKPKNKFLVGLAGFIQVNSILWTMLALFWHAVITGAYSGAGLMGRPPENSDITGFRIGIVLIFGFIAITAFSWRRKFWIRIATSAFGLAVFHTVVYGVYR